MDKRWIYILIILIIGLVCLFFIVDSSSTLGKANVNIGKYTVTIPDSMNVENNDKNNLFLIDRSNNEKIAIKTYDGNYTDEKYNQVLNLLEENSSVIDIENTRIKLNNNTLPTLCYKTEDSDNYNQIFFLYQYNSTFIIKCSNFHDNSTLNKDVEFIAKTMKIDYKQKQS